ncbi:hypothetical protein Tsubulata_000607 [Turnera subulata]|uniref:Uncharacterized protein n=1 Tax=Turnera subulata TaxID=218843 RepID=A0A9Q0GIF4_9ROSI|nr:hypothetical protein Tsubulata_000607 [Turnera subulata]
MRISFGFAVGLVVFLFAVVLLGHAFFTDLDGSAGRSMGSRRNYTVSGPHRRLLVKPSPETGKCSRADIVINQGPTAPLPNGIPTYTVEIRNVCSTGCNISGIHLNCGWFSSALLINPRVFKRVSYNDCLVNDGKPLASGGILSFKYANTFSYPLSVSSVACP